jgi:SAM-dependent methyltransferase
MSSAAKEQLQRPAGRASGAGLQPGQFRRIATAGFGDSQNAYPHAMAWYDGHLYVGTSRVILALAYFRRASMQEWDLFPIKPAPEHPYKDFDIRGQVWRYDPRAATWEKVLTSPVVKGKDGADIAAYLGIRNMIPFTRPGEKSPALYLLTWSPQTGPGPMLLQTFDGRTFDTHTFRGLENSVFSTFRPLVEFNGRMYTTPTGRTGASTSAGVALVFETRDPISDSWIQVNEDNFGDRENETVFEMATFDGHLYAGTHSLEGLQLWKTKAEGKPPYSWKRVLTHGAGRGPTNQLVCSMCVFNGALYVGTAISNGGCDRKRGVGPAPAEILRVFPDDTWDIVVGDGRQTDAGFKMPVSGLGAGFDKISNGYIWRMCVHDGWLYAGTFSWGGMLPFVPKEYWPDDKVQLLDRERMRWAIDQLGGFDFWRTRDGKIWLPVTRNGFANPFNYGVRTMASSPHGLFVGTANPFGPEIAVERASGWQYEPNPRGGLEIWLGSQNESGFPATPRETGVHLRPSAPREPESILQRKSDDEESLDYYASAFYENSGFRCMGYWSETTHSAREACERLVFDLMSFAKPPHGHVLEIGCGKGATTAYLKQQFALERLDALALDARDAEAAQSMAGGAQIHPPNKKGRLPAAAYDLVINVETLSRRPDGLEWLGEAARVMKPEASLLMAIVLSNHEAQPWKLGANRAAVSQDDFAALLAPMGLTIEAWVDATRPCWLLYRERLELFLWGKALDYELDDEWVERVRKHMYGVCEPVNGYYLLRARKT